MNPADCLFVDDRPKNVAGAEAIGMPALLRTPEMDLEAELMGRVEAPPGHR